jgi:hypothetical protein
MANLKKMEDAVNETPWEHILWTSKAVNEAVNNPKLFEQIEELKGAGVLVSDISELPKQLENVPNFDEALNTRVQAAIQDLVSGKPNYMDVKFLSDMVRLAATYQQGGVYMDTDIAPGKVDFSKTTLHHRDEEGEVPLAGVQVQNTQAFAKATQGPKTPEENLFANTKNIGQPVFNFFYATQKGTESNRAALDTMIKYPKATGMDAAVKHFANATNPAEWMVPWLTDLGWTTEASDMQEGEQREKEEGKEGKK